MRLLNIWGVFHCQINTLCWNNLGLTSNGASVLIMLTKWYPTNLHSYPFLLPIHSLKLFPIIVLLYFVSTCVNPDFLTITVGNPRINLYYWTLQDKTTIDAISPSNCTQMECSQMWDFWISQHNDNIFTSWFQNSSKMEPSTIKQMFLVGVECVSFPTDATTFTRII